MAHTPRSQREPRDQYPPCEICIERPDKIGVRCKQGRKTPRVDGCKHFDKGDGQKGYGI